MTLKEKRKLRDMLPYGSLKGIAKAAGVSTVTVSNWFSGKTKSNADVENAVLIAVKKHREQIEAKLHEIFSW